MRLEMTCFLFRLLSCDQENGQYKRGKFIRQSRFPLSSLPWLLWLLHDNLTKKYAEEKPKRFKSNNSNRTSVRYESCLPCAAHASRTVSGSLMRPVLRNFNRRLIGMAIRSAGRSDKLA